MSVEDGRRPAPDGSRRGSTGGRRLRPRVAATIARFELRRSVRATTDSAVQTLAIAFLAVVFLLPFGAAGTYGAYRFGRLVGDGAVQLGSLPIVDLARGGLALAFLGVAGFAGLRAAGGRTELDQPPFLLTGAPVPTVVTGQLLAEWLRLAVWIALPVLAISGGFGVGAGTPLPAASVLVAVLVTVGAAFPVGFAVGFAVRHVATIVEPIARHRIAFGALAFLVYLGVLFTGGLERAGAWAFRTLQDSPLGWLGDLALLGVPGDHGSPLLAAAGVVVALTVFALGAVATTAIARRNWFTDPPQPEDDVVRHDDEGRTRLESVFASVARQSTTTVATTVIRRARRKPLKLVYAVYPLFFGFGFVQQAVDQGYLPAVAVPWIALYGVWIAGVLVTLNPIGDLGDAAPSTVLSGMSGHSFVRGHLLVAVPVGVLLAVGVTAAAVLTSPVETTRGLALVGLAAVGALWAPLVALGVGSAAPRFSSVAVFRNATATLPSKRAFASFSVGLVLVAAALAIHDEPGRAELIAWAISGLVQFALDVRLDLDSAWIRGAAWVTVALGVLAPFAAYAYAVRAFDRFRLS